MPAPAYKFGDFELDAARFELRRNGRVLKLERIPLEVLLLLAEKHGQIVSRQEITDRVWGQNVFVDSEHGINTAIRKIRAALRDDAESPRFVQTVAGRGYRFLPEQLKPEPDVNRASSVPMAAPADVNPPRSHDSDKGKPARSRTRRALLVGIPSLAVVAAAMIFLAGRSQFDKSKTGRIQSIAILPLANVSGDPSQEYFADGMTDELTTMVAKETSLRVISRTSAMQYKGAKRPLHEIARELGVDGIVEGSVARAKEHVHLTVQLIYAPTDTHIWAESYERDLSQVSLLPSEISGTIAHRLKSSKSDVPQQRFIDPEAHDAYLHGRYFWFVGNDKRSQEYFEKAIHIQPDYAAAWAGLADSYAIRAIDNECPAKDVATQVDAAAHRAVELDDSLAASHHALAAWYLFYAWDPVHADAESRRAIELDPNEPEAHHLHSYILFALNRNDEALQEQKRATELGPFTRPWGLGHAYLQLRQFDLAIAELRLRADAMPEEAGIRFVLASAYWHKGMSAESEKEFEKAIRILGLPQKAAAIQKAFVRDGQRGVDRWSLEDYQARARKGYVSPFDFARQYALLGDKAEALKYLEQCYHERYPWLILLQTEPDFDVLHSEPRYQAVVKGMGLRLQ